MPTREDLQILQAQDLDLKVALTKQRVREWVTAFSTSGVYVSFSGGKDSTVLLHIVRSIYPDIEAVFVNTGLEYPEIQRFVKTFDNVRTLYPKKTFKQVICDYGYPMISKDVSQSIYEARSAGKESRVYQKFVPDSPYNLKYSNRFSMVKWEALLYTDFRLSHLCCHQNKKNPAKRYEKEFDKHPITATMTCESKLRESMWFATGCNAFDNKRPQSKPMSFWTEQDVLQYIKEENLPIAPVYGDITINDCKYCTTGCSRTGCIFCGFGAHLEKGEGRFERLKRTHPKQYEFCMCGGEFVNGLWQPNKDGLGMKYVIDRLNSLYGDNFIKY